MVNFLHWRMFILFFFSLFILLFDLFVLFLTFYYIFKHHLIIITPVRYQSTLYSFWFLSNQCRKE